MSERTTIGGTVYESIGSSNSNLLLKCNGTARIQWGSKLIDLVKNGKLVSENSTQVTIITNESDMKSDGFYILNTQKSSQFWIRKDGKCYNLTGTDLYVSANNDQDFTATQKQTILKNIGLYYNTLTEVQNANIQNGIVYILETNTLYLIKDNILTPIQNNIQSVAVENNENNEEGIINSSTKIIISINNESYITLTNQAIEINKSIYIKNSEQLCSENADINTGYRLYINNNQSYLDIDNINIRNGLPNISPTFTRGMIIMYNQSDNIPEGWAICDGQEYEYNGIVSQTPDLTNKFIYPTSLVEGTTEIINYTLIFIMKL